MADSDRIVYPDEAEEIKANAASVSKAAAVDKTSGGDTNDVDAPPAVVMRNVVVVPPNCPPGHEMSADGVCREVWKN